MYRIQAYTSMEQYEKDVKHVSMTTCLDTFVKAVWTVSHSPTKYASMCWRIIIPEYDLESFVLDACFQMGNSTGGFQALQLIVRDVFAAGD